jgi:hypothetical protein
MPQWIAQLVNDIARRVELLVDPPAVLVEEQEWRGRFRVFHPNGEVAVGEQAGVSPDAVRQGPVVHLLTAVVDQVYLDVR